MRYVCLSDTHAQHGDVDVPHGDVLIHAGDFSHSSASISILRDFNKWLGGLPHRYKVVVPGNHDRLLEEPKNRTAITNATLLIDSGVEIGGIRYWGSPVTPLSGVGFGKPDAKERKEHWARIPKGTDVLITHGTAYGVLDQLPDSDEHEGDPELLEAVQRVKPLLHVCGHAHGRYGRVWTKYTYHVNAALYVQEFGGVEHNPIVIDFEVLKATLTRRGAQR